jgi:dienelactone hydrolase
MARERRVPLALFALMVILGGCAGGAVRFPNAEPRQPLDVPGVVYPPGGKGPFPAVVLLHGCHGVLPSTHEWARWLRARGYVALVVDSWAARGITTGLREGCRADEPDLPPQERFVDALGALRFLQGRPDVDPARVGVIGWSNGGAFAMGVVLASRLQRARERGVALPEPGFRAAVAVYPGGCRSGRNDVLGRPLLVLIGGADDWTLPGPCLELVDALRGRGGEADIVVYPGAYHYFDLEGQAKADLPDVGNDNRPGGAGATVAFDATAAADAGWRVAEFLARHLGGHP